MTPINRTVREAGWPAGWLVIVGTYPPGSDPVGLFVVVPGLPVWLEQTVAAWATLGAITLAAASAAT
jgi:hypothetical protein